MLRRSRTLKQSLLFESPGDFLTLDFVRDEAILVIGVTMGIVTAHPDTVRVETYVVVFQGGAAI